MTAREVRTITQRLSLRKPQADSLELLGDVLDTINLGKDLPLAPALAAVQAAWPQVQDFEHSFPSVCFNLATGVGKTRLMGAFIAYLCLTQRSQHFFVLAPNRTIYDKLIGDFTPGSPKYVFKGIAEFAQNPPLIVTGENYESGIGVRLDGGRSADLIGSGIHVNIFNVDKINKEESTRGRPKMRTVRETIGDSYYNYLSGLKDLVVLMDEAHRYRASAGARAINELRPIVGLELTATPKTVGTPSLPFRNVIYSYTLGQAMADGFVKEPAVATRKDFDPASVSPERLEQIKLEDGVHYHDYVSVELDRYHRVSGRRKVHPFILVVAQDTDHARQLKAYIESDAFFSARFKGRVIEIHSAQRGEESEDATAKLVALEHTDQTDIVIHVNKLKEGWDVTNLYTIVPLRASASEILTEQTLGRGLRLPYGERVSKGDGDEFVAVDRLTVIAHDRFDDIIRRAKEPGSIVMKTIEIGEGGDVPLAGATLIETPSVAAMLITGAHPDLPGFGEAPQAPFVFDGPAERHIAEVTLQVVQRLERRLDNAQALNTPEVQQRIVEEVRELTRPAQGSLDANGPPARLAEVVQFVTDTVARNIISIPEIVVIPKRQVTFEFDDFDLADLNTINYRPTEKGIGRRNAANQRPGVSDQHHRSDP